MKVQKDSPFAYEGTSDVDQLTSGPKLARNALWNIVGHSAPLVVAFFAFPFLINGLGTDRFGILSLAWMVIGYFSLFDLGLGRALTKLIAEKLGAGDGDTIPDLAQTGLCLMTALGFLGTFVVVAVSHQLVFNILNVPSFLQVETVHSFYVLSLSIPFVIASTGLRGILEAYQRFDLANAVRIPLGVITFLGPVLVLPFSDSLVPVMWVLGCGRLIVCIWSLFLCVRLVPDLLGKAKIQRNLFRPLLSFGGWMSVSNALGPFLVYIDRFLIGSMIAMAAVAYYVTPYEVATKLWLVPYAVAGVLFPAFSTTLVNDKFHAQRLFNRGVNYIFVALFPVVLAIVIFAQQGLGLWLGAEFAENSTRVLQWISVGVLINSLGHIPFALIQGAGKPDITAKLHLFELPIYLLALWLLVDLYGIEGAAIAWVGRVILDTLLLFFISKRYLPSNVVFIQQKALSLCVALLILLIAAGMENIFFKVVYFSGIILLLIPAVWFLFLTKEDKSFIRNYLKNFPLFN
ncbi:MAG: flippase [Thermodesulfobacteriota bacterium]